MLPFIYNSTSVRNDRVEGLLEGYAFLTFLFERFMLEKQPCEGLHLCKDNA